MLFVDINANDVLNILANKSISTIDYNNRCLFNLIYNNYTYEQSIEYNSNKDSTDKFKIESYYLVHSINEIKCAIINFYAVTAMIPMFMCYKYPRKEQGSFSDNYFVDYDTDFIRMGSYNHQITIVGWIHGYWKVVNSWGKQYGDNGICYMPFEYPIKEAWTCIDKSDDNVFGII